MTMKVCTRCTGQLPRDVAGVAKIEHYFLVMTSNFRNLDPGSDLDWATVRSIADRIAWLRWSLELSQEEFGRQIGLSGSTVGRIESGATQPTVKTLVAIRLKFRASFDRMIDANMEPRPGFVSEYHDQPGRSWTSRTPRFGGVQAWDCHLEPDAADELPHEHAGVEFVEVLHGRVQMRWGPYREFILTEDTPVIRVESDLEHSINAIPGGDGARVRFTFDDASRHFHIPQDTQEKLASLDDLITKADSQNPYRIIRRRPPTPH
ncbi:helix-turn-helix domain-containing protein [Frondihabitans australicus]|nr:helix-turn-helix domain-containing protein [Frondihabitans australicus]